MRLLTDEDESGPRSFNEFHKNPYDLNSKIMLTAIISLSVVVLLVIVLHTYARCVLRRQALRRASMRHHLGSTMAHVHLAEQPKTGLEPSIIAALPTFVFTRVDGQDDRGANAIECAVCLSMLDHDEMARLLPNCIDRWLNSHTTCPICRTEAQPRLQPEPREDPVAGGPTAPPLEPPLNSAFPSYMEGTSDGAAQSSSGTKANGSISRLSSFRKMLSRDRSSRRIQSCGQEDGIEDLERQ